MTSPENSAANPAAPAPAAAAPRVWALVPCAGTGSRAGSAGPKQYTWLAGKPLVLHTLAAFAAVARLQGVLLVLAPGDTFFSAQGQARLDAAGPGEAVPAPGVPALPPKVLLAHCGGAQRAASVQNGLLALRTLGAGEHDWVLVHDAARCLITTESIDALIDACLPDPVGGLLALALPDTLKSGDGGRVSATIARADKWLAQTPQMFRLGALHAALAAAGAAVTDESSAMEHAGLRPLLVPGSAQNFKVTYPGDFALAEALLLARDRAARVG